MIATSKVMALPSVDRHRILDGISSGRFGSPEDTGYITAQEIGIDGGFQLNWTFVGPQRRRGADLSTVGRLRC